VTRSLLKNTGISELNLTPCGTGDEDTCTMEDIAGGGVFIVPEVTLFVRSQEVTGNNCMVEHFLDRQIIATYNLPAEISEWRGRIPLLRGSNNFRLSNFGDESCHFSIYHRTWLTELVVSIVRALILLTLIQTFIVQTYQIPSSSMENTFYPGDYVLVEKFSHFLKPLSTGDVIVFQFPENFSLDFVKRIVAKAGNEVILKEKQLYIDGKAVNETAYARYIELKPFGDDNRSRNYGPVVVPESSLLVFGDNRDNSYDSRGWGALPLENVSGRPWFIYWPPSRMKVIGKE